MKKLLTDRRGGKTTTLIERSAETGEYIVCASQNEAADIKKMALRMGLNIPLPISFQEFIDRRYAGINIKGFLIDGVDKLVEHLSPVVPVSVATMTIDQDTTIRLGSQAGGAVISPEHSVFRQEKKDFKPNIKY